MPTYPFICKKCGSSFELLLELAKRDESQKCPCCGSTRTARDVSAGTVSRRGSEAPRTGCAAPR